MGVVTADEVPLVLSADSALVLFEWLARFNEAEHHDFADQAEQLALWDLAAMLESSLVAPLRDDYYRLLADARAGLRDPTD